MRKGPSCGVTPLPRRWLRQHESVEKLNMHAILSAAAGQEQLLTELLVSHAKVSPGWPGGTRLCPALSLLPQLLARPHSVRKGSSEHPKMSCAWLQGPGGPRWRSAGSQGLPYTGAVCSWYSSLSFFVYEKITNCVVRRDGVKQGGGWGQQRSLCQALSLQLGSAFGQRPVWG